MVGAGVFDIESTVRQEADFIPPKANWVKEAVTEIDPENDSIKTDTGRTIKYKKLVVCTGVQMNLGAVKGLAETLGKNGVASNYVFPHATSTWANVKAFKGGEAIFTQPATPVKCGGGPQKAMYLADDYWRQHNVKRHVTFITGTPSLFVSKYYADRLNKICDSRNLDRIYKHNLVEVRGEAQEAVFINLDTKEEVVKKFDFLHVVPPMSPPDFVKKSSIVNAAGFVDVNKDTTRHNKYANIFSLGDCSSIPTSKTAAAVSSQAPITSANILQDFGKGSAPKAYTGYTSCPIPTSYGKLMLCEFDYTLEPCESTPLDQSVPRTSMWHVKKSIIPPLYWHGLLKGKWNGPPRPWPKGKWANAK